MFPSPRIAWLLLAALLFSGQPTYAQTKLALVAGVEKYEKDGFEELNYAEEDALELKAELEKLGFKTVAITGKDATLAGLNRGLTSLYERSRKLKKEDVVLIFLSGHGVQKLVRRTKDGRPSEKEEPFFCPLDAHKNDISTLLNMNDLLERLKEDSGASNNIVLLDACRESLDKGKGIDGSTIEALPNKLALFFAAQSGHRSFESRQLKHGIFTHYLLEGLRGKAIDEDNEITLQGLTSYVSKRVQRDSPALLDVRESEAQQPNLMGNLRGSLLLGKVSNVRREPPAAPPSLPPTTQPSATAKTLRSPSTNLEMVRIPAGTFMMGSPASEAERSDAETEHRVTLTRDFYLGKSEVTQAEFERVMGFNPSQFTDSKRLPVEQVTWYDAVMFCNKLSELDGYEACYRITGVQKDGDSIKSATVELIGSARGYRLPTESEWEYACRGGARQYAPFSFGATITPSQVNYDGNYPYGGTAKGLYREKTLEVGSLPANNFDLHDMHGNVWEWCGDRYGDYPTGAVSDPQGLATGSLRVLRGGGWNGLASLCRSAFRFRDSPGSRSNDLGFRVALVPPSK